MVKGMIPVDAFNRDAARIANEIKVNGWIRTHDDGSIEACFEGERRDVEALVSWCFIGPKRAIINEVVVRNNIYGGTLRDFKIIRDDYEGFSGKTPWPELRSSYGLQST